MSSQGQNTGRRPELRHDPVANRWVIFSPARAKRPTDFKSKSPQNSNPGDNSSCPFCIGNEHECAPEIFRVPSDPNWKLRVIENLYPALSRNIEGPCEEKQDMGVPARAIGGFGFHDVVIENPVHSVHLCDMEARDIGQVLLAYKKRIQQIASVESIKYVQAGIFLFILQNCISFSMLWKDRFGVCTLETMVHSFSLQSSSSCSTIKVFKNHGASAGASMSHSHSQLLALPIIPSAVSARFEGMNEYFKKTGKCSLCEVQAKELLIDESTHFISIVPFAATYPFEMWIIPRAHSSHFHEFDCDKMVELGGLLKLMLRKMSLQLNNPPFNFMIQTSPLQVKESELSYAHWFLQIVPQLSGAGGFEMGSGCYINPVFPEDAAKVLREVNLPVAG
ncbi:hypothetical protein DKX38_029188 [Salix brachista]|uniref:Galactose-1-phosphate uridyl transferase N-terminal domain-containing protein n=1 Tax=Salix brachista TaxID=2182728 RepID=A0A5N5J224_9ROSI|nr:hypothetical protein DKX38_029188 [Salix brachista]